MPDPIPRSVPLTLAPNDFHFEACINNAPLTQQRVFRLTMNGPGRMILRRFRLRGSGAGRFSLVHPGEVTLTNGNSATFTVTFDPERVRTYKAKVVFSIIHHRGDGSSLLVWGRVPLEGLGKDCAAEKPDKPPPPEQDDDHEGEGDAPGEGGEGAGDGAGGNGGDASGTGSGAGTQPPGGANPGTEPPAQFNGPISEVCLRFWKLPGAADDLGAEEFRRWVGEVNRIYRNSGVQFRLSDAAIERIDTAAEGSDAHCFDIYVGGPNLIPGDVAGFCEGSRTRTAGAAQLEAGAHDNFRQNGSSVGTSIHMESGHPATSTPASSVLAHELGHALGLGPSVPRQDGTQDHLDPDDGQPITNDERLMHPRSGGTKLTERERRIAARMALLLKGGPASSKCEATTEHSHQPDDGAGVMRFEAIDFSNLDDSVQIIARTQTGFPIDARHELSVELAVDDGVDSWSGAVSYSADGRRWRYSAEPARTESAAALPAPSFIHRVDWPVEPEAPDEAFGVRIELPKDYFGLSHRTVGMRLTASVAGEPAHVYPNEGYLKLDLRPPAFTLELGECSREVTARRGDTLRLKGTGWQSATFTGQVGLTFWLRGLGVSRLIELKSLPKPVPREWATDVELPSDIPSGEYRFYLLASCSHCGVDSSVSGHLSVK